MTTPAALPPSVTSVEIFHMIVVLICGMIKFIVWIVSRKKWITPAAW